MKTERKRVEVVATNGEEMRRLLWIEQGHPELLQGLLSRASPDLQVTIFTIMNPWLVVAAQSF